MEREKMNFRFNDGFSDVIVRFYKQHRTTVCIIRTDHRAPCVFVGITTRNYKDKDDPFEGNKKAFERALEHAPGYFNRDERRIAWDAFFAANPRLVEKAA
jgi:hypothetical protein